MAKIDSVCVFCGSKFGNDPAWARAADRLGVLLAEAGIRLVYGGGRIGLMGVVAQSVMRAGGRVSGVIPDFMIKLEVADTGITDLVVVDSMHERKRRMFELADGFVILPGGLGTLDETFEIVTWKQLRQHSKPIVVLNVNGYWSPFADLVRAIVAGGFAHPAVADLFTLVETPEAVLPALRAAPAVDERVLTSHL
ncbi:MAG: TIGR00730 family Rossman fold protein [Alphaproteobacteria bacterium]|nr:TIGR00730 family Rossman fold protein [Alphaproteobacteria bacterium]